MIDPIAFGDCGITVYDYCQYERAFWSFCLEIPVMSIDNALAASERQQESCVIASLLIFGQVL